jgi:hypothetical protein
MSWTEPPYKSLLITSTPHLASLIKWYVSSPLPVSLALALDHSLLLFEGILGRCEHCELFAEDSWDQTFRHSRRPWQVRQIYFCLSWLTSSSSGRGSIPFNQRTICYILSRRTQTGLSLFPARVTHCRRYKLYNPDLKLGLECCAQDSVSFHYAKVVTATTALLMPPSCPSLLSLVKAPFMQKLHSYLYHCPAKLDPLVNN